MKNLVAIRHAKSSWEIPDLPDLVRPLNERGFRDAPFMGSVLIFRGLLPDAILCSPAERARQTAYLIAEVMKFPTDLITIHPSIYMGNSSDLLELLRGLDDRLNRVYLVGHNPLLSNFVKWLTDENIGHLPTCGIASVEFMVESWPDILSGAGRLSVLDYPKRHR